MAARRGEVLVPTPTPPSTTPPMESTSALTTRQDAELHPCIPSQEAIGDPLPLTPDKFLRPKEMDNSMLIEQEIIIVIDLGIDKSSHTSKIYKKGMSDVKYIITEIRVQKYIFPF